MDPQLLLQAKKIRLHRKIHERLKEIRSKVRKESRGRLNHSIKADHLYQKKRELRLKIEAEYQFNARVEARRHLHLNEANQVPSAIVASNSPPLGQVEPTHSFAAPAYSSNLAPSKTDTDIFADL